MVPYNARLWGVPPTEITSAWCERFVPLPKLEDYNVPTIEKIRKGIETVMQY